jgi:hypothetical protein
VAGEAAPPVAFLTITLWPKSTAPAWLDEMSQITFQPYFSPDEYKWEKQLTRQQAEYLRYLTQARKMEPQTGVDDEPEPTPVPIPKPDKDEDENGCISRNVPRKGGHARHDAYATKVSGALTDYFVWPGIPYSAINYDGLTAPVLVWEVKVGFGWFFNPTKAALRDLVLARFDAQKNLGLFIAQKCGYKHLWSIPDKYVAALLNLRWSSTPPVLSLPE